MPFKKRVWESHACSVGVGAVVAGFTGGRVGEEEETWVARGAGLLLARRRQLHGSFNSLAADLWLDPLVHELSLQTRTAGRAQTGDAHGIDPEMNIYKIIAADGSFLPTPLTFPLESQGVWV